MAERRWQGPRHPLTADLAGVLETAHHEHVGDARRLFTWRFRVAWLPGAWLSDRVAADKSLDSPLDSGAAVR